MTARSTAPVDADGDLIQAVQPRPDVSHHQVAIGPGSLRNTVAFNATTIGVELWATADCYIKYGDNTVTAAVGDAFLPALSPRIHSVGGFKQGQTPYLAVIQASGPGILYINEML